ncbi:hypothetical protein SAMN05444416_10985 [Thermoactinomyces sp. DSM 45892]|nr:hypothetical protein SAMN05444416_10985 [Thermoactinomyces sp. DSM 45892]
MLFLKRNMCMKRAFKQDEKPASRNEIAGFFFAG